MKRAAISVPSNIAEGSGRRSSKELLQFLNIALGSLIELETQIEISKMLEFIDDKEMYSTTERLLLKVKQLLLGLIRSITPAHPNV
jgi:four helix bundle protein